MTTMELEPKDALKKFFGFSGFKGDQEKVIHSLLAGHDTFVIMPTGGGKSLCYQLPALMSEGTAIVVSPLIALMKNQVDAIRGFSEDEGVAHFLNSSLNKSEIARVKNDLTEGRTKLLYVAPESLTKQDNIDFLRTVTISFVAIDEAHCISEWGHDFRPEYRRLKPIIREIADVPVIALTATATPKVQQDIQKNLGMVDAKVYKSSFNRPNLFYEVRPKKEAVKQIIQYIRNHEGKSGIIYCLSRKKVEELAQMLQVNGIKALPYHAGMDANQRSSGQDQFLMQDVDVIVATIAFGMGIDKPDVRFVIHYDMPKSLESYYQETGRAGRDGGEGVCIAFYSYKDIEKLAKFLQGKPVAEQEVGLQLIQEVVAYAETSMSRRKFILHYFGEEFDEVNGPGAEMDDNSRYPKERYEGKPFLDLYLKAVKGCDEIHKGRYITNVLTGHESAETDTYRASSSAFWKAGEEKDEKFWNAVGRQAVVMGYLRKEIESYGVLKVTPKGEEFMANPHSVTLIAERDFSDVDDKDAVVSNTRQAGSGAMDQTLLRMLKDERKKQSKAKNLPPYVIFQDASLEEIATHYPTSIDELTMISGVGRGKAMKFGQPFISLIKSYVEDNNIDRPQDMVVKSVVKKSGSKVHIIQNIDRKLPLDDIAKGVGKELNELIEDLERIVASGTKVNIDYYLNDILDEDSQADIYEYFMEAESDSLEEATEEFEDDFTEEELRLMRIKFMSEVAN
ncbi:MAG: RecQ family ATP-dependent DNA helicase [Flavobacteriales bacterium]|nr:RecQ family ATP-dependent DNA helicase [Flavobacteriales bacterium]